MPFGFLEPLRSGTRYTKEFFANTQNGICGYIIPHYVKVHNEGLLFVLNVIGESMSWRQDLSSGAPYCEMINCKGLPTNTLIRRLPCVILKKIDTSHLHGKTEGSQTHRCYLTQRDFWHWHGLCKVFYRN